MLLTFFYLRHRQRHSERLCPKRLSVFHKRLKTFETDYNDNLDWACKERRDPATSEHAVSSRHYGRERLSFTGHLLRIKNDGHAKRGLRWSLLHGKQKRGPAHWRKTSFWSNWTEMPSRTRLSVGKKSEVIDGSICHQKR